jgi:DNA-binding NarL/FixJ family response regulator
MSRIHALLIDNHPIVLEGLSHILDLDGRVKVVGRARSLSDGVALLDGVRPDVIVVNLRLPDSPRESETARAIRKAATSTRIIALCGNPDKAVLTLRDCGIDVILDEQAGSETILSAVFTVCHLAAPDDGNTHEPLTSRELDIVQLAAEGISRADIAQRLFVSENTVKTHLSHVFRKLGLRSRIELVRRWASHRRAADPLAPTSLGESVQRFVAD